MSAKRDGQVRFEVWLPESLYEAGQAHFASTGTTRKAWLVDRMTEEVEAAEVAEARRTLRRLVRRFPHLLDEVAVPPSVRDPRTSQHQPRTEQR